MGLIQAKLDEEHDEYVQACSRAQVYLSKCTPDYLSEAQVDRLVNPHQVRGGGFFRFVGGDDDEDSDDDLRMVDADSSSEEEDWDQGPPTAEQQAEKEADRKAKEKSVNEHKALFLGAIKGWKYTVQSACRQTNVTIDARNVAGRTALYLAAEKGHTSVVAVLVNGRAKTEIASEDGWTPLMAAAFNGHPGAMEKLIKAGASINAQDSYGCTALTFAASSPKLFIMDLLSRKDRKELKSFRKEAFNQQLKLEAQEVGAIMRSTPPDRLWTFYPNRIELIVMDLLFETGKLQVDPLDKKRRTPLMHAARFGRVVAVSRLLHEKADLRRSDKHGVSVLMAAACNEHVETVELLLRAGATVHSQDEMLRTPLHGALETGNEKMVVMLLQAQASVNAFDYAGRTPILLAMDLKNRRLFSEIVQRKSNLDVLDKRGWNVVIYAVETGMLPEIAPLLELLGDKAKPVLRSRDPQGRNAMHHATALPNSQQASKSVQVLALIDDEVATYGDCNGDTSIHMAAELGRLEVLRGLLEGKEAADYLNNRGETPLHYAAHGGHLACFVALIRDRGKGRGPFSDATALDNDGRGILHHACSSGHLDLVNLILAAREGRSKDLVLPPLDVNAQDSTGITPLSIAAREGHWQLLPSLVLAGASLAAKDRDGFTAQHWAASDDEPLSVSCLLDLAADANAVDKIGWTPLMYAASHGCDESIRVLVDSGKVKVDARNLDGDTALQICMRRKDAPELIRITSDIILTDGIMDQDMPREKRVEAQGHLAISVLDASDLYMEGKVGELNTYICVQLRTHAGAAPLVAYSSCVVTNPCPEWHETFRFDIDGLDSTAVLVAWVVFAPGGDADEVLEATRLGMTEKELESHMARRLLGQGPIRKKKEISNAVNDAFARAAKKADRTADEEVQRLRTLALAQSRGVEPTMDLIIPKVEDPAELLQRRWNEVSNLRAMLARAGCEVHEPLIPRSHIPVGCIVSRFRTLRSAVWGAEPVSVERALRLNPRGKLRLDIDFRHATPRHLAEHRAAPRLAQSRRQSSCAGSRAPRAGPRFFVAKPEPRALSQQLSAEEEDVLYSVKPFDITHESADQLVGKLPPKEDPKRRKSAASRQRPSVAASQAKRRSTSVGASALGGSGIGGARRGSAAQRSSSASAALGR